MKVPDNKLESISDFTTSINNKLKRLKKESFIEPSKKDLDVFFQAICELLTEKLQTAKTLVECINYDCFELNDITNGQKYFILQESPNDFRGSGTYIFLAEYKRNLILQVPHPLSDEKTVREGTEIFLRTNARALFISGTRRDSNTQQSPCDGSYFISDVAHFDKTFFQEAHRATLTLEEKPISVSLHGMSGKSQCDIILSDGTDFESTDDTLVNRLKDELLNRGVKVGSCNSRVDKKLGLLLCGTTNVQGRLSNYSQNACSKPATQSTGFFLHIEQKINIRRNSKNLINALNTVI